MNRSYKMQKKKKIQAKLFQTNFLISHILSTKNYLSFEALLMFTYVDLARQEWKTTRKY